MTVKSRSLRFSFRKKPDPSSKPPAEEAEASSEIAVGLRRLALRAVMIALVFLILFTKVFLVTRASGSGMFPSVKDGDLILAFRIQKTYAKNDVVIYSSEAGTAIGRIAAMEGDVVTLDESGVLTVNGTVQNGELPYPTYAGKELTYPYKVPEGAVFLLGDNRSAARDSRDFGAVPMKNVDGKIITILRRRGL